MPKYMMELTNVRVLMLILMVFRTEVSHATSQRVYEIIWPNDTTIVYSFEFQKQSECTFDRLRDNLICMDDYDYGSVVTGWTNQPDKIKYISLHCLQPEYIINHVHTCFCKTSDMSAPGHQTAEKDGVSFCQIDTVTPELFDALVNVEVMDLSSNLIDVLSPGCFHNIHSLQFLNLSNNLIHEIPASLFCGLPNLKILILQHLLLDSFPGNAFSCDSNFTSNIEMIDISNSHILQIPYHSFDNLPKLNFLNFTGNLLTSFSATLFQEHNILQYLDLSENLLSDIDEDLCVKLKFLEKLNLRGNQIPLADLTSCSKLTFLDLSNNSVNTVISHTPLSNLKHFNLSDNGLETITPIMFGNSFPGHNILNTSNTEEHLTLNRSCNVMSSSLTVLDLSRNMLTALDEHSFVKFTCLERLFLHHNSISSISDLTFVDLVHLKVLNLDNNQLEVLPYSVFHDTPMVYKLNLSGNSLSTIRDVEFPQNIVELDLSHNQLVDVPQNISNVRSLYLRGNHITHIEEYAFSVMKQLEVLDLSYNQISILKQFVFSGLNEIRSLHLSHNALNTIENDVFSGLRVLQYLNLSYNKLNHINGVFDKNSLQDLLELNLSNNPIKTIEYSLNPSGSYTSLLTFDCQNCQLSSVTYDSLSNMTNLRNVDFSQNSLNFFNPFVANSNTIFNVLSNPIVCDCNMQWLKHTTVKIGNIVVATNQYVVQECITYPNLEHKMIKHVPLDMFICRNVKCAIHCTCFTRDNSQKTETLICSNGLHNVPVHLSVTAKHIYLDGNSFEDSLSRQIIGDHIMDTEYIYLNRSLIYAIGNKVFSNILSIKRIDLRENSISDLPVNIFNTLNYLEELYLGFNHITIITPGLFRGLHNLRLLDLQGNQIHHILPVTISEFVNFKDFRWLFLGGNHWKCDCANTNFVTWIQSHRSRIYNRTHVFCGVNEMLDFDLTKQDCQIKSYLGIGLGITAACCIALLAGLIFFLYTYRRIILALGYSRLKIKRFHCFKKYDARHEIMYDMVVVFDETDSKCRWWIMKNLMPRLTQYNWKFKIYAANTDDCSQDELIHEVQHIVRHSQCSLFLMSKNFPYSHICMKCLGFAKIAADNYGHVILLITWGGLTREILDTDAKEYLRRGEYLRINEAFVIDKLICLMPAPLSEINLDSS